MAKFTRCPCDIYGQSYIGDGLFPSIRSLGAMRLVVHEHLLNTTWLSRNVSQTPLEICDHVVYGHPGIVRCRTSISALTPVDRATLPHAVRRIGHIELQATSRLQASGDIVRTLLHTQLKLSVCTVRTKLHLVDLLTTYIQTSFHNSQQIELIELQPWCIVVG